MPVLHRALTVAVLFTIFQQLNSNEGGYSIFRSWALIPGLSGRNSMVECQLPKLEVAGSSPVARSKSFRLSCVPKNSSLLMSGVLCACLAISASPR